jgi:hypothetical protein
VFVAVHREVEETLGAVRRTTSTLLDFVKMHGGSTRCILHRFHFGVFTRETEVFHIAPAFARGWVDATAGSFAFGYRVEFRHRRRWA